jgi:PAS domain S-box-containing protein
MKGAESTFAPSSRQLAVACGWAVVALGILVLIGWAIDSTALTRIAPGLSPMRPLTAVALILIGAALVLLAPSDAPGARHRAGVALASGSALIGAVALAEYVFGEVGIDDVLFGDAQAHAGRPSSLTAAAIVLCGLALVTLDRDPPRHRPSAILVPTLGFAVLVTLVGYAYDVDYLRGSASTPGIALPTAIALGLTATSIALCRPDRGIIAFLGGDEPAATLARRLAPLVVLLPLVLGALRVGAEELGLFDEQVGLALTTVASILILIAVIFVSVREQRIADRARRELAAIVGGTSDAVVGWGLDGIVTSWNRGAELVYGYSAAETVGRRLDLLVPPDHESELPMLLERVRAGERVESYETVRTRKDGHRIDIALTVSAIRDERGEVTGVSTIARDISEQKAAEHRLAESARHFELINDLVATCGFDGYFKRLNDAWEPTLGWTRAELFAKPFIELVHPEDREAVETEVARLAGGETTAEFKIRVRTRDGPWVWAEWSASPDTDAGLFYCVGREITERMEAERVRAAERRQFADAQQIASVGSWELNLETGERTWSAQHYRNHGFEPMASPPSLEEVLERIHPDDRELARERLGRLREGESELGFAYRVILGDGRTRAIEVEGRPLVDDEGNRRLIGTSRDVTAERDAERLKDDFFGLVSHELRTPLTSIIGYTELLAEVEAENLSDQGRRFLAVVERNSRRELSLVGDLLLLTKITAGTFEIELGKADLTELAASTLEAARPLAEQAGVELSLESAKRWVVDGDPHRLAQVVENLVSNAIKFTPRGGRVQVRVEGGPGSITLEVSDTGIGIDEEDLGRLFDRMYRAGEAERRHIQGTGLGLTIVKAIIDAHEATIAVSSVPGEGTTFRVELPVRQAADQRDRRARARDRVARHDRAGGRPMMADSD